MVNTPLQSDEYVYLAATSAQKSKTQATRDATRLNNAVKRAVREMDKVFGDSRSMKATLKRAWNMGEVLGNAAARRQHSALGLVKPKAEQADKSFLVSFQKDLSRILSDGVGDRERLRAKMSAEAAVKFAFNSAFSAVMANTNTLKQWNTTSVLPCSYCKYLDGTILGWHEEFPKTFESLRPIKVYKNSLFHPPLHPNCRCVLTVKLAGNKKGTVNG